MSALAAFVERALNEASQVAVEWSYRTWRRRLAGALRRLDPEVDVALDQIAGEYPVGTAWQITFEHQVAFLEGVLLDLTTEATPADSSVARSRSTPGQPRRVFVVHGRDEAAKEGVARYLSNLGLDPLILHEQASGSKGVLEKLEAFSAVAFAVVLLTPDDQGRLADQEALSQPRARQNVIFELGYFIGKLGRSRVCALYKTGVELPSDYGGIVYIEFDAQGAWRTKLAQELVHAGLQIRLDALLMH